MSLLRANLEEVLLHLRHARESMDRLMSTSDDWVANAAVESEFEQLEDTVREYGRCQLGLRPTGSECRGGVA